MIDLFSFYTNDEAAAQKVTVVRNDWCKSLYPLKQLMKPYKVTIHFVCLEEYK